MSHADLPDPGSPSDPSPEEEPLAEPAPESSGPPSSVGGADSSEARAVRGGAFALAGHVVIPALKMVGQIILTRLIPREAFGLMAIVNTFRAMIELFSDIGVQPNIVHSERGDEPAFLDTAWTVQVIRGVLMFAFAAATAVPVAAFYGHDELKVLIVVTSLSALVVGFQTTKMYTAERHLALGRVTLIEVAAQASGTLLMIIWALISPNVWALVGGALVGVVVEVVLAHLLLQGHNPRFGWDRSAARSLIHFGKWIFISTALSFAVTEADGLVFGKMIPLALLGVYRVARTIADIPSQAMESLAARVMFPLFSRVNADNRLQEVFVRARKLHLSVSGWALSGLIGGGNVAIGLIYDERYEAGGWMLQLLCLGSWFATPEATNNSATLASGQPRWVAATNLAKLIGMLILIPLGFSTWGFAGALLGYAGAELFRYVASTIGVYRLGLSTISQDLLFTAVTAVSSVACYFAASALQALGVHVVLQAVAVFVVASVIWLPWLGGYARQLLRKVWGRFAH